MYRICEFGRLTLAVVAGIAFVSLAHAGGDHEGPPLERVNIEILHINQQKKAVDVTFSLRNTASSRMYIDCNSWIWKGRLAGNELHVSIDGEQLPYRGPQNESHGAPTLTPECFVAPGAIHKASVRVSDYYATENRHGQLRVEVFSFAYFALGDISRRQSAYLRSSPVVTRLD